MSYAIPSAVPHLSAEDAAEITRLLKLVFGDSVEKANLWLSNRSDFFNCAPADLLKRDVVGVARVLSYLKDAAP